jgi:hypothetical protein
MLASIKNYPKSGTEHGFRLKKLRVERHFPEGRLREYAKTAGTTLSPVENRSKIAVTDEHLNCSTIFSTVFSTVVEILGKKPKGVAKPPSSRPEMSPRLYHIAFERDPALTLHFCAR